MILEPWAIMLANALRSHTSRWHAVSDAQRDRWALELAGLPDTSQNVTQALRWAMSDVSVEPLGIGHRLRGPPSDKFYREIVNHFRDATKMME